MPPKALLEIRNTLKSSQHQSIEAPSQADDSQLNPMQQQYLHLHAQGQPKRKKFNHLTLNYRRIRVQSIFKNHHSLSLMENIKSPSHL